MWRRLTIVLGALALFGCDDDEEKAAVESRVEEEADNKEGAMGTRAKPEAAGRYAMRAPRRRAAPRPKPNTESYAAAEETGFALAKTTPLSTFSVDTDTGSYSNVRRLLKQGTLPPKGAVRIEEMINYFSYGYPPPKGDLPFSTVVELVDCPWAKEHLLARIGLKGRIVEQKDRKPANLVFLLDVSGSMNSANKLPLLKKSLGFAVNQLNDRDRVAIAVYAGASGLVLPSTSFDDRASILDALGRLEAGGSTNAGDGIELAYKVAKEHFIEGGINRVILATDGDFNVGTTSRSALVDLVAKKAKAGVFLTVLGFGMGNLKEDMLEQLADKGNGSYAYIDDFGEARKVFGQQIGGTLETIAKDVKIQVEFNPARVKAYRLVGYENRRLAAEDFKDDTKDAGEIGAGHTVTALYQVVPVGKKIGFGAPEVDDLKYQKGAEATGSSDWMTVKLRYKDPDGDKSKPLELPVAVEPQAFGKADADLRFATAVAGFGMLLGDSKYKGDLTYADVVKIAEAAKGDDPHGHRAELLDLVRKAEGIKPGEPAKKPEGDCKCPPGDPLCSCF